MPWIRPSAPLPTARGGSSVPAAGLACPSRLCRQLTGSPRAAPGSPEPRVPRGLRHRARAQDGLESDSPSRWPQRRAAPASRAPRGQVTAPGGTLRYRNCRAGGGHRWAPIRRGTIARTQDPSAGPCSPTAPLSQAAPVPPRPPLRRGRICGSGPGQRPPRQLRCAPRCVWGVPETGCAECRLRGSLRRR